MFDDKDEVLAKPLDFKTLKRSLNEAAQPVIKAVQDYEPYKSKGKHKPDMEDMPETMASFFRSAAESLEARIAAQHERAALAQAAQSLKGAKLDKKAQKLADKGGKFLSDQANQVQDALAAAKLGDKTDELMKNFRGTLKDAKLDKKAQDFAKDAGNTFKDAKLDKKAQKLTRDLSNSVKDAKLDKKLGDFGDSLGDMVKDAHWDKKAGNLADGVGTAIAGFASPVLDAVTEFAGKANDTLSDKVKDTHLDKKFGDFTDTLSDKVKDTHLDKKATSVGNIASNAVDNFGGAISDLIKDSKLPEKVFAAANILPGVEVKNPKKAAKQLRKKSQQLGKTVGVPQKELTKLVQQRRKEAQKFLKARQKDLQSGKIRIPGYEPPKKAGFPWATTLLGAGVVYGGLAANNQRVWSNTQPLQSKLPGESHYYRSRQGVIFYKESGSEQDEQPPVVFVHGIGAGNHSYEWEQNFGAVAAEHKVYAFDLLGFGNSERPAIKYTAEVYIKQLTEFLDEVVRRPAIIVASSLCSSYAVQVAYRRPKLIEKLVLMEPTGIFKAANYTGPNITGSLSTVAYSVLRAPVLGRAIYSSLASRAGIKSFMESQMFYDRSKATPERIEQYWIAAHQDGADYAPPSFFTGLLNAEIGETLGKLEQPILMLWAKESRITPPQEREQLSQKNKQGQVETLERTRLAMNQERPEEFNRLVLGFLKQPTNQATTDKVQNDTATVGFVRSNQAEQTSETEAQPKEGAAKLSEVSNSLRSNENQAKAVEISEQDKQNLKHELEEHRKAFIGDNDTGAALIQDNDNDGLEDRPMSQ